MDQSIRRPLYYLLSFLTLLYVSSSQSGVAQTRSIDPADSAPSGPVRSAESLPQQSVSMADSVPEGSNENWKESFGIPGTDGKIRALAVSGEDLYIGGSFVSTGGAHIRSIARWDGHHWQSLGNGAEAPDGPVFAIHVVGENVYVGGEFQNVGGVAARNIAVWNRTTGKWSPLGKGIGGLLGSAVYSLTEYQGEIYAGGRFVVAGTTVAVNIARWDGMVWHRVGTGINNAVFTLATDQDMLYAAGAFSIAGDIRASKVARYIGSEQRWEALPGTNFAPSEAIAALAFDATYVYVAGRFDMVDGRDVNNIARLKKGTDEWSDLEGGITNDRDSKGLVVDIDEDGLGAIPIKTLAFRGTDLVVGGDFDNIVSDPRKYSVDAMNTPRDIAIWDSRSEVWSMMPRQSSISGLSYPSTGLMNGSVRVGSAADAYHDIVRDDQSTEVQAVVADGKGGVFVGGYFSMAGPFIVRPDVFPPVGNQILPDPEAVFASNISYLQGSEGDWNWSAVGQRGFEENVYAIRQDSRYIYAGGRFIRAGGVRVNNVARLDRTTGEWEELAGGVGSNRGYDSVHAIALDGDNVYVGGAFQSAGGKEAAGLALWKNSAGTWSPLQNQTLGVVRALKMSGHDLVAVGDGGLGIWNGQSWELPARQPDGRINAVAVWGDSIFVAGLFRTIGPDSVRNIALYNRKTGLWSSLGKGVDDTVHALEIWNDNLYVGGNFSYAGDRYSADLASWDIDVGLWDVINGFGLPPISSRVQGVRSLEAGRYGVYVGGDFQATVFSSSAGRANGIALWDGSVFRPLGDGMVRLAGVGQDSVKDLPIAAVFALSASDTSILAGGDFQYAGSKASSRFAEWVFPLPKSGGIVEQGDRAGRDETSIQTGELRRNERVRRAQEEWLREGATSVSEHQLFSVASPHPDDQFWDDRFGSTSVVPGTSDEVFAIESDSTGVYIGGVFSKAGTIEANSIVHWDGLDWEILDDGSENGVNGFVFDILIDGDLVYVAGQFSRAGGVAASNIAIWNRRTRQWSDLGGGVTGDGVNVPYIATLTLHDGDLYAGGNFVGAGGTTVRNIARWDGTSWSGVGAGVDGGVNALCSFQNRLFVGGSFGIAGSVSATGFAWFDGTAYHTTEGGVNGIVNDFDIFNNRLIIGGRFEVSAYTIITFQNVRARDTMYNIVSWDSIRGGEYFEVNDQGEKLSEIRDLLVDSTRKRIYTAGDFRFVPEPSLSSQKFVQPIIRNVGYVYQDMGWKDTGLSGFEPWFSLSTGSDGPVNAMAMVGDDLYVGGSFTSVGADDRKADAMNVAIVHTRLRNWRALISGRTLGYISAIALNRGRLYAAGPFTEASDPTQRLDAENHLAYLTDAGWKRMHGIINGGAYSAFSLGDTIILGGSFYTSDATIGVNLSQYNPVTQTWSALSRGNGVASQNEIAYVNTIVADNRYVYVGGDFGVVDTFETPNVAMFDRESGTWHRLGDGLDKSVWSLALSPDGVLYAGGEFHFSGSRAINGIARWDGTAWQPVGSGVDGSVLSLVFGNGELYVGGTYTRAGGIAANNISRYNPDNGEWQNLAEGLSSSFLPAVNSLAWQKGRLYAGGFFQRSGVDSMKNIARWYDGRWERLGSGTSHAVWTILPDRQQIYVAGVFDRAGEKSSRYIGLWHDPTLTVEVRPIYSLLNGIEKVEPNPVRTESVVRYHLAKPGDIRLEIRDLRGELIDLLASGRFEAGDHRAVWTPSESVAAGIYFCRLVVGDESTTVRIVRY